jgi:hypothetical protein
MLPLFYANIFFKKIIIQASLKDILKGHDKKICYYKCLNEAQVYK